MGDTIKIIYDDNSWTEITGLTEGVTIVLQNVRNIEALLQQVVSQPDADEEGKVLLPFKSALIIKEVTAVWIRSKVGKGTAFFNALP